MGRGLGSVCRQVPVVLLCMLMALHLAVAEGPVLVLDDDTLARVEADYGHDARQRVAALRRLLDTVGDVDERAKLQRVNDFFNSVPFSSDQQLWGATDYWATPIEMLGVEGADCEDYAIAKYFALRELGVPDERLRITYVRALELDQAHMVLAYYATPRAEPVILDNLENRIRPARERNDLMPVYSFNGTDLWLSKSRARGQRAGSSSRIKRWNALRSKILRETGD